MKYSKLITLTIALVTVGTSMTGIPFINEKETAYASESTLGKSYVEYGKTNIDLETIDGSIIEKGTPVARASRMKKSISGSYYLVLYDGIFMYQAWGEVPEKYVTSIKIEYKQQNDGGYLIENEIPESATKAPLKPVKGEEVVKEEGDYIKDGRYVTYSNKNYNTYSNFGWKYRHSGSDLQNKTFQARGKYNHQNGSIYLSLYDNKGTWYGYVNEKAVKVGSGQQGAYIKDGRYVTLTNKNYNSWSNFGWKYRHSGASLVNKTYQAKGKYNHINGSTYLSLYDNKGKWFGYINEKGTKIGNGQQGAYVADGRKVKVTKKNYQLWQNFSWKKRQSSNKLVGKTFVARGKYYHANGSTYYSLFDNKGNWQGYINANGVK